MSARGAKAAEYTDAVPGTRGGGPTGAAPHPTMYHPKEGVRGFPRKGGEPENEGLARCSGAIDSDPARGWSGGVGFPPPTPASAMRQPVFRASMIPSRCAPGGFGPFDDDFDPFEDEEEASVLIPLD